MQQAVTTSPLESEILEECQKAIGYRFRQPELLRAVADARFRGRHPAGIQ